MGSASNHIDHIIDCENCKKLQKTSRLTASKIYAVAVASSIGHCNMWNNKSSPHSYSFNYFIFLYIKHQWIKHLRRTHLYYFPCYNIKTIQPHRYPGVQHLPQATQNQLVIVPINMSVSLSQVQESYINMVQVFTLHGFCYNFQSHIIYWCSNLIISCYFWLPTNMISCSDWHEVKANSLLCMAGSSRWIWQRYVWYRVKAKLCFVLQMLWNL